MPVYPVLDCPTRSGGRGRSFGAGIRHLQDGLAAMEEFGRSAEAADDFEPKRMFVKGAPG